MYIYVYIKIQCLSVHIYTRMCWNRKPVVMKIIVLYRTSNEAQTTSCRMKHGLISRL